MTPRDRSAGRQRFLRPRALFLGAACAFAACCLAGRVQSRQNHYPNFVRFHRYISPEGLHYPTASQMLAVAEAELAPGQVAVVVGGNSVLFGYGQSAGDVWSAHLQRLLGDRYRVLNFSLKGGTPAEFGAVAAEALARRRREVLCVTNVWPGTAGTAGPAGRSTQPYLFWDAYCKGLLEDHPELDAYMAGPAVVPGDEAFLESRRQGRVDSLVYARDLWTAVGCDRVSTVWCPAVGRRFLAPRNSFADEETTVPPEKRNQPAAVREVVGALNDMFPHYRWPTAPPDTPDADYSGTPLVQSFKVCFPESRRRSTLVLINHISPYILRRLDPAVREQHLADYPPTVHALRKAGFAAEEVCAGFSETDFVDYSHLSPEGAVKLAAEVAPRVRQMAEELGYTGPEGVGHAEGR
jgi:hypothetical protein